MFAKYKFILYSFVIGFDTLAGIDLSTRLQTINTSNSLFTAKDIGVSRLRSRLDLDKKLANTELKLTGQFNTQWKQYGEVDLSKSTINNDFFSIYQAYVCLLYTSPSPRD